MNSIVLTANQRKGLLEVLKQCEDYLTMMIELEIMTDHKKEQKLVRKVRAEMKTLKSGDHNV